MEPTLILLGYYLLSVFFAVLVWPYTYGSKGPGQTGWLLLGIAIVFSPLLIAPKLGIYYGLLANFTNFGWTADTYMGKTERRARSLVGGLLLALAGFFSDWPTETWLRALLIPSLGHIAVSGCAWPLLLRVPLLRIPFLKKPS